MSITCPRGTREKYRDSLWVVKVDTAFARALLLEEDLDDVVFPLLRYDSLMPDGERNVVEAHQAGKSCGAAELQLFATDVVRTNGLISVRQFAHCFLRFSRRGLRCRRCVLRQPFDEIDKSNRLATLRSAVFEIIPSIVAR